MAPGASRPRWISSRGRPVRDPDGARQRLTGISFDVTGRKLAEQESRERLEFETLIADLSSRFINLPAGDVDREIEDAQRRVCEVLGIDLSALWQGTAADGTPLTLTHFYAAEEGLLPPMRGMSAEELFPWLQGEMLAGRAVCVSSLEELPPEAALDRDNLRRFGVRSNLTLPLSVGGASTVAALGFNSTRSERDWPEPLVKRLRLVGQVFANALARKRAEEALGAGRDRLEAAADLAGLAFYEVDFADADRLRRRPVPRRSAASLRSGRPGLEPLDVLDRAPASRTTASACSTLRQQLHDGTLERLYIEYRFLHPTRGEKWLHHVARVDAARRRRAAWSRTFGVLRDITERRRARGGAAAVARGDRAAEGPAPGGERLPQGRDQGGPPARRGHRAEPRHPEGPAPGGAGRAHGLLGARPRRDRHAARSSSPRPSTGSARAGAT